MADGGSKFSFFLGIHVRTDVGIDIFISIRLMTTNFGKQLRGVDQNETNQVVTGDIITL